MERTISYREAVNEAHVQEMERDERVFVFGLDVDDHKRIYGSTIGLVEKFGPDRCFGTPVSEDAMTGMALGAALSGLRPIHVHIRVDFLLLAINQIANMITTAKYMSGGDLEVPLVIRAVVGRGWGQSAQHSKSLQSVFAHLPGLKVVMPTTPVDAKGLLAAAIRDDGPVVVLEHRWLYDTKGPVPEGELVTPLGVARTLRAGRDATVVATSWMAVEALRAADLLAGRGIEIEVIDPRTISPFDADAVVESVEKTGRCVVADNDWSFCGFAAEVAATVAERCFGRLAAPVARIGWAFVPCPTSRDLENHYYPNAGQIVRAVEAQLGVEPMPLEGVDFYTYENRFKGPF